MIKQMDIKQAPSAVESDPGGRLFNQNTRQLEKITIKNPGTAENPP
jgi:hypothetical protein